MAFALNSLESAPNLTNCFRLEYIGTNCFIPYNSSMRWEEISIPGSVLYLARDAIFGAESVTLQQGIREIGESAIPYIDIENLTVENIIPPIISEYNFLIVLKFLQFLKDHAKHMPLPRHGAISRKSEKKK